MREHRDNAHEVKRSTYVVGAGMEVDIPAPCCVWAKFAVIVTVRVRVNAAPAAGDVNSFRLLRDTVTHDLVPGEVKGIPFAQVAADFAAGVESRDERLFLAGASGLRVRNGLNVAVAELIVEWKPYTLHNIAT